MSYTREAVSETSAIPTSAPIVMREAAVVDPYAHSKRAVTPGAPSGQPTITEAPVTPAPAVTLSPQVAALARKEQRFRQEQDKFKADQAALATERAEIVKLKELKEKLAAKDYSALEGSVDYDEYTQYQLNKLASSDPQAQELKSIKDEVASIKKANEEQLNRQYDAAVKERKVAAEELIKADPKLTEFKTRVEKVLPPEVKLQDVVTQHILDTWEHDSEELTVQQATREVQEAITEKAKAWATVLGTPEPVVEEKKQLPPLKPGLKTITNQVTAGELKAPTKSFHGMTDDQRWAEARRRAEAKLLNQTRG